MLYWFWWCLPSLRFITSSSSISILFSQLNSFTLICKRSHHAWMTVNAILLPSQPLTHLLSFNLEGHQCITFHFELKKTIIHLIFLLGVLAYVLSWRINSTQIGCSIQASNHAIKVIWISFSPWVHCSTLREYFLKNGKQKSLGLHRDTERLLMR